MHRVLLVLVGALLVAGCGSGADVGDARDSGAAPQGSWQLRSGTVGGADLPRPPGARATLEVSGDEARGTAFCNQWFATVRAGGSALSLEGIGQTELGCAPEVMAAEAAYLGALAAVDGVAVEGERLVLTGDGVELRFEPVPAVPDSPLEGTRWVLDTLLDGETASSVLGDARLELAPDGTLTASTGCRTIGGTWRADGDALVLDAAYDSVGCPPPADRQDEHVLGVFAARPAATIDGDRLTLTAADGRALAYRAT